MRSPPEERIRRNGRTNLRSFCYLRAAGPTGHPCFDASLRILGRRTIITFGLVTFLVSALLATVNITSRYALKRYMDDQLSRIP